jgi:hypothetical protein
MIEIITILVSTVVSLTIGLLSYFASKWQTEKQLQQSQLASILAKRIETYPKLWSIHIRYETNWTNNKKAKDRAWVEKYLSELNEFNIENGLFFSQELYEKFFDLRENLLFAQESTPKGKLVDSNLTEKIRNIVYGDKNSSGLSTILKDDLGSYSGAALQKRIY